MPGNGLDSSLRLLHTCVPDPSAPFFASYVKIQIEVFQEPVGVQPLFSLFYQSPVFPRFFAAHLASWRLEERDCATTHVENLSILSKR